jgi:hypothetical protein
MLVVMVTVMISLTEGCQGPFRFRGRLPTTVGVFRCLGVLSVYVVKFIG